MKARPAHLDERGGRIVSDICECSLPYKGLFQEETWKGHVDSIVDPDQTRPDSATISPFSPTKFPFPLMSTNAATFLDVPERRAKTLFVVHALSSQDIPQTSSRQRMLHWFAAPTKLSPHVRLMAIYISSLPSVNVI